jgi:hypothetical protein
MNEEKLQSAQHRTAGRVLRIAGPVIAGLGVIFLAIGIASFFAASGTMEMPRYFWCAFVGIPMLFVGLVMCQLGYLGAFYRYVASESAPVAKDVANYLGENTQPGVKSVAKAITEGIIEAQKDQGKQ